jgi:pantoate--beta-alanine ligase
VTGKLVLTHTIEEVRRLLDGHRSNGRTIGFVPTMGALHAGHGALIERASHDCDVVVVSIFVNPLQFAPTEDLDRYPRTLDADCQLASAAGAHVVFAPSANEMYPPTLRANESLQLTSVSVSKVSAPMEGISRPHFFTGVATVVAKLFAIVGPCRAYFGEKDFQQLAVVRRMAVDLCMPVEVIGCETVREPDGLAMSSRNRYLAADERVRAASLSRALQAGRVAIESGDCSRERVLRLMRSTIGDEAYVDYLEIVDAHTLAAVDPLVGELRLLVAARVGSTRLIDNLGATAP